MRDHKSHVVKKFYLFKNIALNTLASIQEIKRGNNEKGVPTNKGLFYDIRWDNFSYV